jgi:GTPase SAR1 family protein
VNCELYNTVFNEARIIILDDKGAGKTCLARRLVNSAAKMTTAEESTDGVDSSNIWQIENRNAQIWDFAGHIVTHTVHQIFYRNIVCILLCVTGARRMFITLNTGLTL